MNLQGRKPKLQNSYIDKDKQVIMRFTAAKPQCCYYTLHSSGC